MNQSKTLCKKISKQVFKLFCLLSFSALSVSCAYYTSDQSTHSESMNLASNDNANSEEEMECRSYKVTGSNLKKRQCDTKANWDAQRKRSRGAADEYARQVNGTSGIQPPPKELGNVQF